MYNKSVVLVCCLFVFALAIFGCGGGGGGGNPAGPVLTPGATASLSGTVLFNNTPTAFASVYLYKSEKAHTVGIAQMPALKGSLLAQQIIGDGAYSTTTDGEGVYSFNNIPVGQYTLIAVRDENHQFVQTGVLLGQVTTLNPQLTPTGKITGKVTLSIGGTAQAISGVFVYINGTSYIAVSDTTGQFTINNVPSNSQTTGTAYEILVSSTRGTASSLTGVVVGPGATTDIGTIAMTAPTAAMYTTLNGTLVPGKNVASVGDLFVILTHQTSGSIFGTHTDANGNYQFKVVESGNFLVICPEEDYNFTPDPLMVQVGTPNNEILTLSPITVDATQVVDTGTIAGTVIFNGSPLPGAVVHASGTSLIGVSNAAGQFVINNVPVNTSLTPYTVEVSSSMGAAQPVNGVVVNVGQVTNIGPIEILLPPTGYKTITGQLVAVAPVTTSMLGNRLVQLIAPDGKVSAAYSDSAGAFSFITVQSGMHTVTVMDRDFIYDPRTQSIDVLVLDNGNLTLPSINARVIDNTGTISGTVTTMGPPVTGVSGAVVNITGTSLIGVTDSGGNYIIERVPVNITPYTLEVSSNIGTAGPVTGVMVSVDSTTPVNFSLTVTPVETKYRVDGMVNKLIKIRPETDNGGVSIKLTPEAAIPALFTTSNPDGSFIFMATPGTYTLTVEGAYQLALSPISFEVTGPYMFPPPAIDVRPISPVNSIVEGTVTWATPPGGWMLSDGEVIMDNQAGTPAFSERRVVSLTTGFFRFENVPPGSYTVTIDTTKNGYSGQTAVYITEGQDFTVANTTALSIPATFFAPFISTVSPAMNTLSLLGQNFDADDTMMKAVVDGKSLPPAMPAWTTTTSNFDITALAPGTYNVQLVKYGNVYGNKAPFTRDVMPPTGITAESTDTTITFNWQNAPYITAVDVRLLQGATIIRPLQRIIGNSITYDKLLATTTPYTFEISSTYPNLPNSTPATLNATTTVNGINNIASLPFTGAGIATGTIFGFEVVGNYAYVAFEVYNDTVPQFEITIQRFDLISNTLANTSPMFPTMGDNRMRSIAANSTGVYLTYTDLSESDVITLLTPTLTTPQTKALIADFGFSIPVMSTVRSLNDRVFLAASNDFVSSISIELRELNSLLGVVATYTGLTDMLNPTGKFIDVAWDASENVLYLADKKSSGTDVRAFAGMDIELAPSLVGNIQNSGYPVTLYASNRKVYLCDFSSTMPMGYYMDATGGYSAYISGSSNPGSFGFDKQNRIWIRNTPTSGQTLLLLDSSLSVQKSLKFLNDFYITNDCPVAKLDRSTGTMYMLHFNASNQLAVYKYNSNF